MIKVPPMKTYAHLNQTEFEGLPQRTVAVIPLGAMENHGNHLPLGTDSILADAILDRTSVELQKQKTSPCSLRLPCLWLGASIEHSERPGTLTTPADKIVSQILDIVEDLARNEIERVILLNAHGGNTALAKIAAIEARAQYGTFCASEHWTNFGVPENLEPPSPVETDIHAGWMETSMMMAVAPELVASERPSATGKSAPAPMLYPDGPISWGWMSDDLGVDGVIGNASVATPEVGHRLLDHIATSLAALIVQMSSADWDVKI